ncbi:MAG: malonyl-CoA decarboxylase [Desulfocapsaceae bacterium]
MAEAQEPLWDRTRKLIREYWPLGDPVALKDVIGINLPKGDLGKVRRKIEGCLEGKGGEVSARARAAELGEAYLVLNANGRRRFLTLLAEEYDVDPKLVEVAMTALHESDDSQNRQQLTMELRNLLEPPRAKILRQFNGLQGGVKFLVDLRAELMRWAKGNQALQDLDKDVYRLLASWFDIGFLDLQRITWQSSAELLEKFIQYEAVHEIRSWKDLKNRLEEDRRCYAFFHPSMPNEPLIFVEVALVNGISTDVHELLDEKAPMIDPDKADTAIFYSISNCQDGLAGVSFGNFLIKRVVADLAASLPGLKNFATLSPIPGFTSWLNRQAENEEGENVEETRVNKAAAEVVGILSEQDNIGDLFNSTAGKSKRAELARQLQQQLLSLCATYLLKEKRGNQVADRVAHFHLTNGALVKQINWAANLSDNGVEQSLGMMVNYLYDLPSIEKQHEAYRSGEISASSAVKKLVR